MLCYACLLVSLLSGCLAVFFDAAIVVLVAVVELSLLVVLFFACVCVLVCVCVLCVASCCFFLL